MDAVALAMVEALPTTAPTVGWQGFGALPETDRYASAVSTDGTRIYVSHGRHANTSPGAGGVDEFTNTTFVVQPNGSYATAPNISVPRQGVAGAWCNGKHYAIGGFDSGGNNVGNVEAYTPAGTNGASGVWSSVAGVPQPKGYMAAAVIGTSIYAAGGQGFTSSTNTASNGLLKYDTTANTWTSLANMPAARTQGAMVAVGTKLYYLGGLDSTGTLSRAVYIYDTTAGTWSTSASPLGFDMGGSPAAVINGVAYATNGTGVNAYNLTTGASTAASTTTPTSHGSQPGLVAIGSALYYVSGSGTANVDKLDLGAGTGFTTAVLGAKSLLNPLLAGVASILPATPPTDTPGKAAYAQTVQTLKALAAL